MAIDYSRPHERTAAPAIELHWRPVILKSPRWQSSPQRPERRFRPTNSRCLAAGILSRMKLMPEMPFRAYRRTEHRPKKRPCAARSTGCSLASNRSINIEPESRLAARAETIEGRRMIWCLRAGNTPWFFGRPSTNVCGHNMADRVSRIVADRPRLTSMCTSWLDDRHSMFGDGATRPNSGVIVGKTRFDGQLPTIQWVLRTGVDRRITVERPAPRATLHARMIASTLTLDLARRMAEEDTVGWLGAPVGRGILWQLFKVFGHAIHRVPRDNDKGRGREKSVEVQSDVRIRRNHRNGAESGAARGSLDQFDEKTDQYRSPNCRSRAMNPADRIRA